MRYKIIILTAVFTGAVVLFAFQDESLNRELNEFPDEKKMNGVSFVAPDQPIGVEAIKPIKEVNANWVAVTPYAFTRTGSPELRFNISRQWWGERAEGTAKTIEFAHHLNLKVMLKPHVWVRGQGWAGEFDLETEEEWKQWEKNYRDYILSYAKLSDSLDVEMISIGTEYRIAVRERPAFWEKLIREVRSVYDGKLTYAANWDNYENIAFWDELDYIGIDSYFPLSEKRNPTVSEIKSEWQPVKEKLKGFSEEYNKVILFTEFGYQSVDYTTDGHWKYGRGDREINLQAQADAYRAVFETFWDEPWFGGGFLWKWFDQHERRGGPDDTRYTPQNKPAEETIRRWYGQERYTSPDL